MNSLKPYFTALITAFLLLLIAKVPAHAQMSVTTENMALGGGGTSYLTGYEALFVNPANLYIQEKNYRLQISLLQGGGYFDSLLPVTGNRNRFNRFFDLTAPYDPSLLQQTLNDVQRDEITNRSFDPNRLESEFVNQTDFYWFGLKWVRPERSYALSLRSRVASRYQLGQGFFSDQIFEKNGMITFDQSLNQRYQTLHEFSFGFAESFTLLNGLLPQLSEFIIGIAPKVVLPGSYLEADYQNRYEMNSETNTWNHHQQFNQRTSGLLTESAGQFFTGQPPASNYTFSDMLRPSGIGFGLDIGLTWLITFGDDFSVLRQQDVPTEQSLRLSFSVTDLGAVYYAGDPMVYETDLHTEEVNWPGPVSDILFEGAPNEHYNFLSQFDSFNEILTALAREENFDVLLPMSINAGGLFQYKRLKLMGDFTYSIVKSAFNPSGITSYFGVEVRPMPYLPIRGGTRMAPHLPGYYSIGTGFETRWFDLNASVQLKSRNGGPTSEILGASVIGLKFYIQ
ncbi:MAG: hypothetical protein JJU13_06260 [Balneolaceae bacterium]|nr:hypothetical protein [Balneolaceae bacterium]